LLQYVGGVADTNSTQIIKVVPNYILKWQVNKLNFVLQYIFLNAILLMNGTTIHSLLGLLIDRCTIISKSNSIINIWHNVQFIVIIDKISMVCCILLDPFKSTKKINLTFQHSVHGRCFIIFTNHWHAINKHLSNFCIHKIKKSYK